MKTLGEICYDAYTNYHHIRLTAWDNLSRVKRERWEAAAGAVLKAMDARPADPPTKKMRCAESNMEVHGEWIPDDEIDLHPSSLSMRPAKLLLEMQPA